MDIQKCKDKTFEIKAIYFIDPKDIKVFNETELTLKRKYGKFKREVKKYEPKNNK